MKKGEKSNSSRLSPKPVLANTELLQDGLGVNQVHIQHVLNQLPVCWELTFSSTWFLLLCWTMVCLGCSFGSWPPTSRNSSTVCGFPTAMARWTIEMGWGRSDFGGYNYSPFLFLKRMLEAESIINKILEQRSINNSSCPPFSFGSTGIWTQGFLLVRQVPEFDLSFHFSHAPALFALVILEIEFHFLPRLVRTVSLPF
jgi:hypothetical protein